MAKHLDSWPEFLRWARRTATAGGRAAVFAAVQELVTNAGPGATGVDVELATHAAGLLSGDKFNAATLAELEEIGSKVTEVISGQETESIMAENPSIERIREMNAISTSREGAEALQRARTGQPLTAMQAQLVREYESLEKAHNDAADSEKRSVGGTMKGPRTYIPSDAMSWLTNPHKEQRRQLAAEWKARTLNDRTHPYWDASRGAEHKSAVKAMKAAYEMAETGEVLGVQINPADGSVIEE
jgi:hypothetical protein